MGLKTVNCMANRTGISGKAENPDLEKRLLEIESSLANVSSDQAPSDTSGATRPDLITPPSITGFRLLSRIPGGFTIGWTHPSSSDIKRVSRFEIHVATNLNFTDIAIYYADRNDTVFLYSDGDPEDSFYVRMRANGPTGIVGPFTGTLDTRAGKIIPALIVPDARYSYVESTQVLRPEDNRIAAGWEPATGNQFPPMERVYVNRLIEVRKAKAFIFSCAVDVQNFHLYGAGETVTGQLLFNGAIHTSFTWSVGHILGATSSVNPTTISFMGVVEPTTPSVYNVSVRLRAGDNIAPPEFPTSKTWVFTGWYDVQGYVSFEVCSFTFRFIQLLD